MINGVDDYLYNFENNPHIKFAIYEDFGEINILDEIRNIAKQIKPIDIIFKSYSFYPNKWSF